MKQVVAQKSRAENRNVSRLPEFTESEKIMNKGTVILFDFFSKVNRESIRLVRTATSKAYI